MPNKQKKSEARRRPLDSHPASTPHPRPERRGSELVFVLAATNLPWELDVAMLRRLEKRILVPLPNAEARKAMFGALLAARCAPDVSPALLAARTEGFSGSGAPPPLPALSPRLSAALSHAAPCAPLASPPPCATPPTSPPLDPPPPSPQNKPPTTRAKSKDVRLVAKEAAMRPLRRLMAKLSSDPKTADPGAKPELGPVNVDDVEAALTVTKPSARLLEAKYLKFNDEYGQMA